MVLIFDLSVKDFRQSLGFLHQLRIQKVLMQELTKTSLCLLARIGTLSFGSVMFLVPVNDSLPASRSSHLCLDRQLQRTINSCLNQMIISPLSKSFHYGHSDPLINPYLRGGCDIWTVEDVVDATFGFTLEEVRELKSTPSRWAWYLIALVIEKCTP
ncbi:hypothetical protein ARMSODRAFT_960072 [Armillaria solidipes]|uniref:Uncharacterized protein n=1 Tax=Armillaria solidipes TaxID=1076256 RepID=A0A2H3BKD0_9AGAR|nr:hypothetical protein ARMSODRAFT_960072 [Armillaria solidipes]